MTDYKDEIRDRMGPDCKGGRSIKELQRIGMKAAKRVAEEIRLPPQITLVGYGVTGSVVSGGFGRRTDPIKVQQGLIREVDMEVPPGILDDLERGTDPADIRDELVADPTIGKEVLSAFDKAACSDLDLFVAYKVNDIERVADVLGVPRPVEETLMNRDPDPLDNLLLVTGEAEDVADEETKDVTGGAEVKLRWVKVVEENPSEHIFEPL